MRDGPRTARSEGRVASGAGRPDSGVGVGEDLGEVDRAALVDRPVRRDAHRDGEQSLLGSDVGRTATTDRVEDVDVLAAIRDGRGPDVGPEQGLLSVAMGVAAHRSIDEGRAVTLAEVLADPNA